MKRQTALLAACLNLAALLSYPAEISSPQEESFGGLEFVLQAEISLIQEQWRVVDTEVADINKLIQHVSSLKPRSDAIDEMTQEEKDEFKKALSDFQELPDDAEVSLEEKPLSTIFGICEERISSVLSPLENLKSDLKSAYSRYDRDSYMNECMMASVDVADESLNRAYNHLPEEYSWIRELVDSDFDFMFGMRFYYMRDETVSKSRIRKEISALGRVGEDSGMDLLRKLQTYIADNLCIQYLGSVLKTLNGRLENKKMEKENLRTQLGQKAAELANIRRDEAAKESTVNKLLIYAVYGMIAVLVSLFLGLRIFPEEVAKRLIEKRSLVEVVGMAFMLITIIILSTGDRLSPEILGTLLGTIAGYVFGRGIPQDNDGSHAPPG